MERRVQQNMMYFSYSRRAILSTTIRTCYAPLQVVEGGFHHLCHNCDATTTLPSNYYPRYINQILCNPNLAKVCLQGHGECRTRFTSMTFLKKTGNCVPGSNGIFLEEWLPEVIFIGSCCECMIKTTSFFTFFL